MSTRSIVGSKRGTTLVEILVTMVVLLVGILTIVRMFPTGFGVVRMAESRTIATKLAQAELERWKAMSVNLPTGILPIDDSGTVLNGQYPGAPFDSMVEDPAGIFASPDGRHLYRRGNVLNIRQIMGETTRIPVGSYFTTAVGSQYGARYTLAFGPIDVSRDNGKLVGLAVKSGDLRRRGGRREFYPPYLRLGEYAVDYGEDDNPEFYLAFPTDPGAGDRLYYVSYSYWATDNNTDEPALLSALDQEVLVPAGNNGEWVAVSVSVQPGFTFDHVEDGTDTCARGFVEMSGGWSQDNPYEFALSDNILGVISFNPVGHAMFEYTAQGVKPIEARIDYRILDPRIIREDRVVPKPDPGATIIPVKMALRFILGKGDPTDNPNEPVYKGLHQDPDPAKALTDPILLIDLSTGMRVDTADVDIDGPAGVVNLPETAYLLMWDETANSGAGDTVRVGDRVPLAGRQLRFLYRADGDWTTQCQKAYALYAQEWGTASVDYRHFRVGGSGNPNRLYFSASEAEKTVAVDYSYTSAADGVEHKVCGESRKISESSESGADLHYIDLNVPADASLRRVYAVVGTSFKVRIIWRDSKSWRHVDLDSSLTRGAQ